MPYLGHACPLKEGVPLQFVFAVMKPLDSGFFFFFLKELKRIGFEFGKWVKEKMVTFFEGSMALDLGLE